MRLTQIRLAGFKSFVEPTAIPVPGQLVAVCGPNGCGKSNVIDAVRWVLGESSARQLRGESMQDVIFNGSDQRKPAARASVELVFDNSQQRASGPWASYAEIAIRRVLTRTGDSTYFINNQAVRRRDITDLFLGTGVGARGYAVIEQGMISRIIEARPEELRLFLEEAAGVSRYKERRRETESRLQDARDNLLRLDDIRLELGQQLEKLQAQAQVAQQYLQLQADKKRTGERLAVLRLLEAEREQARWLQEGLQAATAFEASVAGLREVEARLDLLREQHFAAADALHLEQGRLYEANARLARLEQQLSHVREARERLGRQLDNDRRELQQVGEQDSQARAELAGVQQQAQHTRLQLEQAGAELARLQQELPQLEAAMRQAQQERQQLQQQVHERQRQLERLRSTLTHQDSQLHGVQQREQRLRDELRQQAAPGRDLALLRHDAEQAGQEVQQQRTLLEQVQQDLQQARQDHERLGRDYMQRREQEARLRARAEAIQRVLQAQDNSERLQAWLQAHGWQDAPRLLDRLHIRAGWEAAVEGVLQHVLGWRLLTAPVTIPSAAAPARAGLLWPEATPAPELPQLPPGLVSLASIVQVDEPWAGGLATVLHGWCCTASGAEPDAAQLEQWLQQLPAGWTLVLADGRQLGHGHLCWPAAQEVSVLQQRTEFEQLQHQLQQESAAREQVQQQRQQLEQSVQEYAQARLQHERGLRGAEQHWQEVRLQLARQEEQQRLLAARQQQIADELDELQLERETLALARDELQLQLQEHSEQLQQLQLQQEDDRHQGLTAEVALDQQRSAVRAAERDWQELQFQQRLQQQKQDELQRRLLQLEEQRLTVQERLETARLELDMQDPMQFDEEIQLAMEARAEQERVLAQARDALNQLSQAQRQAEDERRRVEEGLEPLRQRVQQLQLKEQEARLHAERQLELLQEVDRSALEAELTPDMKTAVLAGALTRLQSAIDALGAVNLAAVEELAAASERQQWLDAQASDLHAAIDTLTEAIARIDAETRERLLATYEQVNRNLGELFPRLFGGGRAELVLTGEEILDAGLQIIAQPPGKKNSSITLLSGGEKALTALSLVFALFRLNPAPFCLLDEVDAPLDDANTLRFCDLVKAMSEQTQFLYISHNRLTMEMAQQLIGITMQEKGVSRMVAVDVQQALTLAGS